MNYVLTSILCVWISSYSLTAKAQSAADADFSFSAGYGFPSITKTIFNIADGQNVQTIFIGPVYGKVEYSISETVGFGLNFAYSYGRATYETSDDEIDTLFYNTSFKYKSYSALARFNFHFGDSETFDPYAGVGFGYRNANYSYTSDDPEYEGKDVDGFNHFGLDFTIGARLFITENIGLYGEVGIAKSPMQAGIVVKF